jgi:hypothetical protein
VRHSPIRWRGHGITANDSSTWRTRSATCSEWDRAPLAVIGGGRTACSSSTTATSTIVINGRQAVTSWADDDQSSARQYKVVIAWDADSIIGIAGVTQPPGRNAPPRAPLSDLQLQTAVDGIAQSATYVP